MLTIQTALRHTYSINCPRMEAPLWVQPCIATGRLAELCCVCVWLVMWLHQWGSNTTQSKTDGHRWAVIVQTSHRCAAHGCHFPRHTCITHTRNGNSQVPPPGVPHPIAFRTRACHLQERSCHCIYRLVGCTARVWIAGSVRKRYAIKMWERWGGSALSQCWYMIRFTVAKNDSHLSLLLLSQQWAFLPTDSHKHLQNFFSAINSPLIILCTKIRQLRWTSFHSEVHAITFKACLACIWLVDCHFATVLDTWASCYVYSWTLVDNYIMLKAAFKTTYLYLHNLAHKKHIPSYTNLSLAY